MKNDPFPPILLVSGKGGVGKTFISSLLAKKLAAGGKRVLLVEMGSWSYLQSALELPVTIGFQPQPSGFGFDLARWSGEDCLSDYIHYIVKVPWMTKPFMENSWMRSLIQIAPGLREIALLGKITSKARQHGPALHYDHIVVDAVSSGHFLALLQAPRGLAQVVTIGPIHTQSLSIVETLNDPNHTGIVLVSNLESYSVQETIEIYEQLQKIGCAQSVAFVANKGLRVPESGVLETAEAQEFLQVLKKIYHFQQGQKGRLQADHRPVFEVPYLFNSLHDLLGGVLESDRLF